MFIGAYMETYEHKHRKSKEIYRRFAVQVSPVQPSILLLSVNVVSFCHHSNGRITKEPITYINWWTSLSVCTEDTGVWFKKL